MGGSGPCLPGGRQHQGERTVLHVERVEDQRLHQLGKRLATGFGHHQLDNVAVDAEHH